VVVALGDMETPAQEESPMVTVRAITGAIETDKKERSGMRFLKQNTSYSIFAHNMV
jgi:hypothetical protein